ncbi:hypothetical protein M407DRAFT_233314 [Tulasnella calospora MUT 4182]|uniref:Uncharacterized protein n=1 Tax=Tulasnella calospora MUT 4182 TaxID=1051891 RepID=A0A0C3QJN0_9AGAM|nr:hypothetical protein M407DRAFT_233314 [Tulasnella calospora MUT 4182]
MSEPPTTDESSMISTPSGRALDRGALCAAIPLSLKLHIPSPGMKVMTWTDFTHNLARLTFDPSQLDLLRDWSPQLATFSKDQLVNLIVLCPNHHREYHSDMITIVPTPQAREQMKQHELKDFELRQQAVAKGRHDPGRRLLFPPHDLLPGLEYVPITTPYYLNVYNATDSTGISTSYLFDSLGKMDYRNGSLNVFPYPLLLAAYQPLNDPTRHPSDRINRARTEVMELVDLYRRKINPPNLLEDRVLTANLEVQRTPSGPLLKQTDNVSMMPAVPEALHGGSAATDQAIVEELGPGSFIRTSADGNEGGTRDEKPEHVVTEDLLGYDD